MIGIIRAARHRGVVISEHVLGTDINMPQTMTFHARFVIYPPCT